MTPTAHDHIAAAFICIEEGNVHGAKANLTRAKLAGARFWDLAPAMRELNVLLLAQDADHTPFKVGSITGPVSIFDPLVNW